MKTFKYIIICIIFWSFISLCAGGCKYIIPKKSYNAPKHSNKVGNMPTVLDAPDTVWRYARYTNCFIYYKIATDSTLLIGCDNINHKNIHH